MFCEELTKCKPESVQVQLHNRQTDRWIAGLASSPWFRPRRGASRDTVMRYVTAPRYHYKSRLNKLVEVFCPNQPNYEYSLSWDLVGTEGHLLLSHFGGSVNSSEIVTCVSLRVILIALFYIFF